MLRTEKELKEAEKRFFDIIWWNRHKVLEKHYKKTGDFPPEEIWNKALEEAEKIEKDIPDSERILNEFDWGMVNGKLSAIRWVLGDEWDNLSS